ncbi:MAG: hypothetical protein K2X82_22925 [Gemmataceae bacterium]|nr:hypothetical protein [Gemmataceae bacterium]
MRATCFLLLAAGLPVGCGPDGRPDPPSGPSERADALELLVLSDVPERLELRVVIDGRPVPAVWDETFAKLHAYLDRDGDGSLDHAEAARLPSAFALRQVLWGQFTTFAGDAPLFADLDLNGDGKVGGSESADFYRRAGLGGVLVGVGRPPATGPLTDALLKRLDTDGDGAVGEAEWKAAARVLLTLDANGDDLVGPGELVDKLAYPGALGSVLFAAPFPDAKLEPVADALPFLVLPLRTSDTHWQAALTARREREKKPAVDVSTLRRGKPAVAWSVELNGKPADAARRVHSANGLRLDLRTDGGKLTEQTAAARRRLAGLFAECDADSDRVIGGGELDATKAEPFRQLLATADRDGDGRLTEGEFGAWLDLQGRVAKGHVLLTVLDHGCGLFELLDADHDGSLSVRELRTAWDRLQGAGCVAEKGVDQAKLPRQLLAAVSHGHPLTALGKPVRPGPAWFAAMDRNGDGDVSAREWIGDADVFDRLDRDRDGLLDPREAAGAGK